MGCGGHNSAHSLLRLKSLLGKRPWRTATLCYLTVLTLEPPGSQLSVTALLSFLPTVSQHSRPAGSGHPEPMGVQAGLPAEPRDLLQGRCQARLRIPSSVFHCPPLHSLPPTGYSQQPQVPLALPVSRVPRTNPRVLFPGHTLPNLRCPDLRQLQEAVAL